MTQHIILKIVGFLLLSTSKNIGSCTTIIAVWRRIWQVSTCLFLGARTISKWENFHQGLESFATCGDTASLPLTQYYCPCRGTRIREARARPWAYRHLTFSCRSICLFDLWCRPSRPKDRHENNKNMLMVFFFRGLKSFFTFGHTASLPLSQYC